MCKNCKMPNAYYCETPVIYDLGRWLMVEFGCWGLGSWYSLSFGASIASWGMSMSLSSSSSLCPSSTSKMFVPCKVVMIFQLKHFDTIFLVGCRPSISKMPSLVCGCS
jgi:hypothetical protein